MHLKQDFNIPEFLSAVQKCDGEVYFNTAEGDSLALRSLFCQYIFCELIKTSDTVYDAEIILENANDLTHLQAFIQA